LHNIRLLRNINMLRRCCCHYCTACDLQPYSLLASDPCWDVPAVLCVTTRERGAGAAGLGHKLNPVAAQGGAGTDAAAPGAATRLSADGQPASLHKQQQREAGSGVHSILSAACGHADHPDSWLQAAGPYCFIYMSACISAASTSATCTSCWCICPQQHLVHHDRQQCRSAQMLCNRLR
jgi:hypothetical protein